jgi:hypothetical protein
MNCERAKLSQDSALRIPHSAFPEFRTPHSALRTQ